jgi:hypothetical protein
MASVTALYSSLVWVHTCNVTAYRNTVSWQCGRDSCQRNVSKVGYVVTLRAGWITKATNTHSKFLVLLLFHGNSVMWWTNLSVLFVLIYNAALDKLQLSLWFALTINTFPPHMGFSWVWRRKIFMRRRVLNSKQNNQFKFVTGTPLSLGMYRVVLSLEISNYCL